MLGVELVAMRPTIAAPEVVEVNLCHWMVAPATLPETPVRTPFHPPPEERVREGLAGTPQEGRRNPASR